MPRRKTLPALAMSAPRFQGVRSNFYTSLAEDVSRGPVAAGARAPPGSPGRHPASGGAAVLGAGVGGGDGGQVDLGDAWPGAELVAQAGEQRGDLLVAVRPRADGLADADLAGDQQGVRADDQHLQAWHGAHPRRGLEA